MKKLIIIPVILMLAIVSVSMVTAAPGGATNSTAGASSASTGTSSTDIDIEGGNVTFVNIVSNQATTNWAGFYGNVSGGLVLSDSSANSFFEWTITSWTGAVVYATNNTVSDWGSPVVLVNANTPSYVNGAGTDNFTNTFNGTESFTSQGGSGFNILNTPYATTIGSGNFKTYALYSGATDNANIWAGKVVDDGTSFKGDTVDYQILLPADTTTSYYFYMELP